ncbi:MAG: glycosyltransferase family 39 protein [Thiohalomonadaceae bacterium]
MPAIATADHEPTLASARAALALVLATAALHLLVAGRFDLGVDEAHYALFGRMLDWSYFDHPPMVGWMQALALALFGSGELALRLWPITLGAAAGLLTYRLARELFPEDSPWTAFLAVAVLQSALIFQLVSMAMVPEDPLLVFGLGGALFLFRAVRDDRLRDWLAVGLLFGLAGLSKYTAVVLVITALLFLLSERGGRGLLRPGPWLAALVALVLVLPVLWWNARHGWISFAYQWGHGAPDRAWDLLRFLRSFAGQLLAYAPGIVVFGLAALWATRGERRHAGVRFSLFLALPLLLLFAWSAGLEETLPHWTLLAWTGLAPLTARWLSARWPRRGVRWGAYGSLAYSGVLVLLVHSQLLLPWIPFPAHAHPFGDLYGWREAAARGAELQAGLGEDAGLFVGNWSLASRVAWYANRPVQVADSRFDQFDLWYGAPRKGAHGVLIVPERYADRPRASGVARFARCEPLDAMRWVLGDTPVHTFRFLHCRGYGEQA